MQPPGSVTDGLVTLMRQAKQHPTHTKELNMNTSKEAATHLAYIAASAADKLECMAAELRSSNTRLIDENRELRRMVAEERVRGNELAEELHRNSTETHPDTSALAAVRLERDAYQMSRDQHRAKAAVLADDLAAARQSLGELQQKLTVAQADARRWKERLDVVQVQRDSYQNLRDKHRAAAAVLAKTLDGMAQRAWAEAVRRASAGNNVEFEAAIERWRELFRCAEKAKEHAPHQ